MVLPLFPAVWGLTKLVTLAAALKGTVWGTTRLIQHGGDFEATIAQLEADLKASKEFGSAVIQLLPALAQLRLSNNLAETVEGAHAAKRVLNILPDNMRNGLNQSVRLGDRIDTALKQSINRCGIALLVTSTTNSADDTSKRLSMFYFGLFLVGRSGNVLANEHQTIALSELKKLHQKQAWDSDWAALAALDRISDPQQLLAVQKSFMAVSGIDDLKPYCESSMAARWIMKALGCEVAIKENETFLDYLTSHFEAK